MTSDDIVCEIDTDGIIITCTPYLDNINEFIENEVKNKFFITNCTLEMDVDKYVRGIIYRMKNYIMLYEDSKNGTTQVYYEDGSLGPLCGVEIHGVTFKSSSSPKVYDDAVESIVIWLSDDRLKDKQNEIRDKCLDINHRPIDDFIMTVKLNKNVSDYVGAGNDVIDTNTSNLFNPYVRSGIYGNDEELSSSQLVDLSKKYRDMTGVLPQSGTTIQYLYEIDYTTGKTSAQCYNPSDITQKERLDFSKYKQNIAKLFESTEISSVQKRMENGGFLDMIDNMY